jgi:large subunit ribosomal protein L29
MEISQLRKKSKKEMNRLLLEKRDRLRELRFDLASGRIKNVREMRQLRRDIARILTLLKEEK